MDAHTSRWRRTMQMASYLEKDSSDDDSDSDEYEERMEVRLQEELDRQSALAEKLSHIHTWRLNAIRSLVRTGAFDKDSVELAGGLVSAGHAADSDASVGT